MNTSINFFREGEIAMNNYVEAELEIVEFEVEDVITASGNNETPLLCGSIDD